MADELGVALVTVMADGSIPGARAFVDKTQLHAPVVIGDMELLAHLGAAVYPWTVVLDRSGRPVKAIRGGRTEDEFRSLLRDL